MIVVSSVVRKNEYKLLGTKSEKMVTLLRPLKMPLVLGFLKNLTENNKVYSDDDVLEEELIKYAILNKKR